MPSGRILRAAVQRGDVTARPVKGGGTLMRCIPAGLQHEAGRGRPADLDSELLGGTLTRVDTFLPGPGQYVCSER